MMKKLKKQDKPATQRDTNLLKKDVIEVRKDLGQDIELLGGNLVFQINEVREEQDKQGEKMDHMQETLQEIQQTQKKQNGVLESLLSVTQMLAGQYAQVKDTPERIENHEERITNLEVKVRILQK